MPEGETKNCDVERIVRLLSEGSISLEKAESLFRNIEDEERNETRCRDTNMVDGSCLLHHASGEEHHVLRTKRGAEVYVRVSTSGQETMASPEAQTAPCVKWAKSGGCQVDEADVHRETCGGDADA